jgi:tRNA dimethylallyltransferase
MLGPTAVGKTSAVKALADLVGAVIYADMACLYRDLIIGVTKPSLAEQQLVPHYMIDKLTIQQNFSAAEFVQQADEICHRLHLAGRVSLMTGGSLFYIRNFLFGLSQAPPPSKVTRLRVQELIRIEGLEGVRRRLQEVDVVSAHRLAPADSYRLTRALEVYYESGKPLSTFAMPHDLRDKYEFLIVGLERPRAELYERINLRVEQMWVAGLPQELARLRLQGLTAQDAAAKCIGYREFFMGDEDNIEQIKETIKLNTRHYAKRQMTFLRSLPCHERVMADDVEHLRTLVQNFIEY